MSARLLPLLTVLLIASCGYDAHVAELPPEPSEGDERKKTPAPAPTAPSVSTTGSTSSAASSTSTATSSSGTTSPAKTGSFEPEPEPSALEQQYCSGFCDDGTQFCRDRGDGVRMCMGDNPPGAYCVSSLDCAEGFCKSYGLRGLKRCMGDSPAGAPCQSAIDCAYGFCGDRGDGLDVCMD